jgi:LPXTG-motif cell wall-anchored protein
MSVVAMAVLGALALPMLAAGAQTTTTSPSTPPGDCVILSVTPNPIPATGALVSVTGTAPNGVTARLFVNGVAAAPANPGDVTTQLVTNNTFSLAYNLSAAADVSVGYTFGQGNAYTAGCSTPAGATVVRVNVAVSPANVNRPAAALAFTGSSDTPSYVLIGIAAIVLGTVLVVAARRRKQVS